MWAGRNQSAEHRALTRLGLSRSHGVSELPHQPPGQRCGDVCRLERSQTLLLDLAADPQTPRSRDSIDEAVEPLVTLPCMDEYLGVLGGQAVDSENLCVSGEGSVDPSEAEHSWSREIGGGAEPFVDLHSSLRL